MAKRRMSKQEAADLAKKYGINLNGSFFELSANDKSYLNDLRKTTGYTYKSTSGKSQINAFFESLKKA